MALEIELKFLTSQNDALRQRLQACGAQSSGRHLERNVVYDTPARELRGRNTLLRLRSRTWAHREESVLTLKRPPEGLVPEGVKVWQEDEICFEGHAAAQAILEGLGYVPAFSYDKLREDWQFGTVCVSLDTLVFGDVVEIEGERDAIHAAAAQLGLDMSTASTATYHDLNRQWRMACGLPPQDDFAFDAATTQRILAEL